MDIESLRLADLAAKRAVREAKKNGTVTAELLEMAEKAKAAYRAVLAPEAFKRQRHGKIS